MKNTIINILIIVMMFNVILLIFPDGKTQKFCKMTIKIFLMIYIINNIIFGGNIAFDDLMEDIPVVENKYEREISMKNMDKEFIDSINNDYYNGEEVIKEITIQFNEDMKIMALVTLNKMLSIEERNSLISDLAKIFKIDEKDIVIDL